MKLPDYERVIYQRNPLIEVVCQLRFPTILKISNQEPVDFQEEVRFEYPLFEVDKSISMPAELFKLVQQIGSSLTIQNTTYNFKSEDLKWQLSINKDFIAIATTEYEVYEKFKAKFKKAVEIFEKIYKPSFYSRVGLKYQNLIIRSNLNLQDKEWSELIPFHIAAELHRPELSSSVKALIKNLELITDGGQIKFNHGLVIAQDPDNNVEEPAYLLDADFFTEGKIGKEDVWTILDKFKQSAGRLFRWSITDELHKAMEPKPIEAAVDQLSQFYK